ncbi:hypothetical protein [Streptomyces ortus]|uniref:Uncharacterized protein n=1 Tax=Streptomyces ortus TaxID=2867268 RepID=A0ABT3V117_9ACTN|nr:hypothetical protein [Streptomyces ortus]MCX4232066.1 hypothetical protein [Streptomyces ortus]
MTSADDILAQIDHAVEDWAVSEDAMRSQPEPEPFHFGGATPTLYIADEVGEWQQVEGVTSIEVCVELPVIDPEVTASWARLVDRIREAELERVRRTQAALVAFMQAVKDTLAPVVEQAGRDPGEAFRHLPEAEGCNQCTPPPRRDRPAWQSPYGPARRRR